MGVVIFLNGKFVPEKKAVISVFDRGFLYGDGLFETIRVVHGRPFRWAEHMERLKAGAKFLKIKLPFSPRRLGGFASELIARNKMPDSLLRISVSRGVGTLGYSPKDTGKPTLVMSLRTLARRDWETPPGWRLITSSIRVATNDPLARFKTSNKLAQVLARAQADEAGADEALLANTDGFVAEATSGNVFWMKRDTIYTPPLMAGILPGVTREVVFEIAAELNISIREKNIRLNDLRQADGVFLSLTSLGIVEAQALDDRALKKSTITPRVQRAYSEILS
jgi:branched-chain amino acid aminotransferase